MNSIFVDEPMELSVQKRDKFGKAVKTLRQQGLIPAELYGRGLENLHLSVPAKEFSKVFKQAGESTLINIVLGSGADAERRPAMIHALALDPVSDEILNIDFYQVRLDERIKVKVPLNFGGEAPAVKDKGGILVKAMHEIEVESLPGNIPHTLNVNLSSLEEIGASVYVKDLSVSAGVKFLVSLETVIATVKEKAAEEVITPEVAVESVKVETEEKKAERLAKKAAPTEVGASLAPKGREAASATPVTPPPKSEKQKT